MYLISVREHIYLRIVVCVNIYIYIYISNTQKWYLIPLCLTLSIIRYVSRVKWNNPGKGVAPSSTPRCSSY